MIVCLFQYTQNGLIILTNSDEQKLWRHASSHGDIGDGYKYIAPFWTNNDFSESEDVKHEVVLTVFVLGVWILRKVKESHSLDNTFLDAFILKAEW